MASTLTISLDPTLEDELAKLAAAIRRDLDDMATGRLAPHDEVLADMRAIIGAAEKARRSAS